MRRLYSVRACTAAAAATPRPRAAQQLTSIRRFDQTNLLSSYENQSRIQVQKQKQRSRMKTNQHDARRCYATQQPPAAATTSDSSSSSSLVPLSPRQLFVPHIPFNSIPLSVTDVPVLAVSCPAYFPGSEFEFPVDAIPSQLRVILNQRIQTNRPYLGLFAHRDAVQSNQYNKKNAEDDAASSSSSAAASASASSGPVSASVSPVSVNFSLVSINSLSEVCSSGVLCHFYFSGGKLKGGIHRRIKLKSETETTENRNQSQTDEEAKSADETSSTSVYSDIADIVHLHDFIDPSGSAECNALTKSINSIVVEHPSQSDFLRRSQVASSKLLPNYDFTQSPGRIADFYALCTRSSSADLQFYVSTLSVSARLKRLAVSLKVESDEIHWQLNIQQKVQEKMNQHHQRGLLKEQRKVIDSFLGLGKTEKETLKARFEGRIKEKLIPAEVRSVIDDELAKLNSLEPEMSEFNITRNYLDWLTVLPWGINSKENFSVSKAKAILDEEHYGMEEVKKRILEIIAAGKLAGRMQNGKIVCLLGSPGVGKTSIGKSIARALGRKFYRLAVGGMDEISELKGHRRTYVGAMPGKILQALKLVECQNPVILIDEIDKLSRSSRGDPSAALLEVLDPEQNSAFADHYIDVPVDLSKVLFICTANSADSIPAPLADRIEFIKLAGYLPQEKLAITQKYLEPAIQRKTGVSSDRLNLSAKSIEFLIRWYCRESGVRNLERQIEKIYRKVALKIVKNPASEIIEINPENLADFVGKPVFSSDRLYEVTPVGVSMGLAWNSLGGSCIFIESVIADQRKTKKTGEKKIKSANKRTEAESGTDTANESDSVTVTAIDELEFVDSNTSVGELVCTGQLDEVMKESATIAYTVAKLVYKSIEANGNFFHSNRIHLHIPAGATPKDGPAAGITLAASLLSLALNQPLRPAIAMTGELSLTGKVLPVAGIRDKLMAARQSGVMEIILPAENKKEFTEIPEFVKENMKFHFVEEFQQVVKLAFNSSKLNLEEKPAETYQFHHSAQENQAELR